MQILMIVTSHAALGASGRLTGAVRDGQLITGQNPASSEAVARLVLEAFQDSTRWQ